MESGRKEITLGENTFYIKRFPPFTALKILGDLQKQFAGPFLSMIDGKETQDEAERTRQLMEAFSKLSAQMDGDKLVALAKMLIDPQCVSVSLNGDPVRQLDHNAQPRAFESVTDIITLCWEIIAHNYSEVLTRIASPTGPARNLLRGRL